MRHDEMRLLRWRQVDFLNRAITVGRSKTDAGAGRAVPLNQRALEALEDWAAQFPDRKPNHHVFASEKIGISGNETPIAYDTDPAKPILRWKTSWTTARTAAGVTCRFHDLRHTTVTRLRAGRVVCHRGDCDGVEPRYGDADGQTVWPHWKVGTT